jgi:phosphopantetheinyl transferase (holo-ACP synthase)
MAMAFAGGYRDRVESLHVVSFPAIGNDVVDLTDPGIVRHHENRRFVERVCSESERPRVTTATDLWSLFAAKEAAYKALVKMGCSPGFGHRALGVAPDLASVAWKDRRLALVVTVAFDHVHAVAWTAGPEPLSRVVRADGPPGSESERARAVLRDLLSTALGCAPGAIEVVRDPIPGSWDGYGPPRVTRAGVPIDADVSLSHDGPFVAAAALLGERQSPRTVPP